MNVAVLGVGLIGGSIGLAARGRLGARVTGYDPDAATLARATEVGAVDQACETVGDACAGAEIIFCAGPVGALPDLVAGALEACDDGAVVTDVGSTKLDLVTRLEQAGRLAEGFIGGHPLAGAETSGVENARADLFEGARWYLTPTEHSGGVHYDRLQRAIADIGARPQAIDADTHDRVMAEVSHLPHVLANVLVNEAARALAEESERLPEVGPSFRDTTRVAGANPALWTEILLSNREAVAGGIDSLAEQLKAVGEMLRAEDSARLSEWIESARDDRRRLLEAELTGGPVVELRVVVPNRPGVVAELALALGRAGVNIEDMTLHPAADMSSGAVSLWIAGDEEADRAVRLIADLGYPATRGT